MKNTRTRIYADCIIASRNTNETIIISSEFGNNYFGTLGISGIIKMTSWGIKLGSSPLQDSLSGLLNFSQLLLVIPLRMTGKGFGQKSSHWVLK